MPSSNRPSDGARRAILILGPHRSGTSVVTRALQGAGIVLGQDLLAPNDDNPKGFFENAAVVAFNDRLLKHLGLCWDYLGPAVDAALDPASLQPWIDEATALLDRQFGDSPLIGIKDPRLCLLAPFWSDVLERRGDSVDYVLVLRHPLECADSQARRYRRDPAFHFVGASAVEGCLLWAIYMHESMRHLRSRRFTLAHHAHFVRDPSVAADRLATALGLDLSASAATEFGQGFIEPSLHRHRIGHRPGDHREPVVGICEDVFDALAAPGQSHPPDAEGCRRIVTMLESALDSDQRDAATLHAYVRARHAAVEANLELLEAKRIIAFQEALIASKEQQLSESEARIDQVQQHLIDARRHAEQLSLRIAASRDLKEDRASDATD